MNTPTRRHILLPLFILHFTFFIGAGATAAVREIPAAATEAEIQAAITAAQPGDTIAFAPGATHVFANTLTLKDGITIDGRGCTWDATAQPGILQLINTPALKNVTLKNIVAKNILLRFWVNGANYSDINNIVLSSIRFQDGKAENPDATGDTNGAQINSRYILLKSGGVTIVQCQFLRTSATPGKGIHLYLAQNTTITGCLFGATLTDGADSDTHGWFKTAINTSADSVTGGFTTNTLITASKIYRTQAGMDESGEFCDHGIYAHHFDGLEISGNTIAGWPPTGTGGAMKLRNAQNGRVLNNTLLRSGILLYTYTDTLVPWLKNILIRGNTIKYAPWTGEPDIYHGIGYWRNFGTPSFPAEYSIRIASNTLENTDINLDTDPINRDGWNAAGGGVFDNTVTGGHIYLLPGINNSGNTITPAAPSAAAHATLLTTLAAPDAHQPAGAPGLQSFPNGATYAPANDRVYTVNPAAHTIDQLDPDTGATTTISGAPGQSGNNDGPAPAARYNAPRDLAADTRGNLYIADTANHTIRKIDARTGQVTTLAGRPGVPGHDDGPGHLATLSSPDAIHIDTDGRIYISDSDGETLRQLQIAPVISLHPAATTATTGATITLTAEATGAPTPDYQWYHNGAPIPAATTGTLTLAGITAAQTGAYTLAATNPLGSDTSTPAQVALAAAPSVPPTPATAANTTAGASGGGAPSLLYLLALAALLAFRRIK